MNKFTKLLSVFVIAGAVGAGVAGLTGCGGEQPHTHSATKHEAVAATCTQTGTKEYYTCDGSDCEGKYFEDEACTTEVTLESLTIAALGHSATKVEAKDPTCTQDGNEEYYTCSGTECEGKKYTDATCTTEKTDVVVEATGHTEKYTDKGNGTHGITCEKGDLTETTEAHVDENGDSACDKCETLFFAAGNYYNLYYGTETLIEIKANGKIVYNETEYTLSAVTENAETKALSATFTDTKGTEDETDDVVYTLTKTEKGYKLSYLYYGSDMSKDMLPVPETYAESISDFAGVYSLGGEYKYSSGGEYFKLSAISITEDGNVIYTAIKVNEDGSAIDGAKAVTRIEDVSSVAVKYNKFTSGYMSFTATAANCATVEFVFGNDDTNVVTLTKTADAAPVVPADMGLTEFTQYVNADESYSLLVKEEGAFTLNNSYSTKLISGNATDGYLIITTDSNYDYVNFVLKINATDNTVDLYDADGTTKIDTLSVKEQVVPAFAVSSADNAKPTINQSALVDVFNTGYAYYKIETAGWYYFNAPEKDLTIYTSVDGHDVSYMEGVVKTYAGFYSKGVELAAGDIIAVSSYDATTKLFGYVESTQQDDKYSAAFTSFDEAYYGTYTYQYEAWFGWEPETVTATIVINENGMIHSDCSAKLVATDGTNYIVEVTGYAVKFSFDSDGNMAIASDGYTGQEDVVAVKGGTSGGGEEGGETDTTVYVTAGDNIVEIHEKLGTAEITLNKVGVWTVTYGEDVQYILAGTATRLSGSTIEVTDTPIVITVYAATNSKTGAYANPVTINFALTSGTGEEISGGGATESGLVVGTNTISNFISYLATEKFTAPEAGSYTFAFTNGYSGGVGTTVNNEMVTIASDGTGSITVTLSAGQTITVTVDAPWSGNVTLTIAKA